MNSIKSLITEISFRSDGLEINGWLHLPGDGKYPLIIGSHGFLSDGKSAKMIALAKELSDNGIAFFRFDHRGCGSSDGIFAEVTSLEGRCKDMLDAVGNLGKHPCINGRIGLFGSSMGGATAIAVFKRTKAEAVVSLAAPVKGSSIIRKPDDPNPHSLSEEFYKTGLKFDITENLPDLKNILIFHGRKDQVVPCENAISIMEKANEPKKLVIFENGDHRITDPEDQHILVKEAGKWFCSILK